MQLLRSRYGRLSLAFVLGAALAGLAVWPRLPAEMAIHFTAGGRPDSYVPRAVGVALVPALMLGTLALLAWAFRVDPPADPRTGAVVTVAAMGLLAAVHVLVLAWNLGYAVDFSLVLAGSLAWAVAVTGYVVRREGLRG